MGGVKYFVEFTTKAGSGRNPRTVTGNEMFNPIGFQGMDGLLQLRVSRETEVCAPNNAVNRVHLCHLYGVIDDVDNS